MFRATDVPRTIKKVEIRKGKLSSWIMIFFGENQEMVGKEVTQRVNIEDGVKTTLFGTPYVQIEVLPAVGYDSLMVMASEYAGVSVSTIRGTISEM